MTAIPLDVATCLDCGGEVLLTGWEADTCTEQERHWICVAGHTGTLRLGMTLHRHRESESGPQPMSLRNATVTRRAL